MSLYEINKAADVVWELVGHLDQFIADYQPFKMVKNDSEGAEKILWSLIYALHEIKDLVSPYMPGAALKMGLLLGTPEHDEAQGKTTYMVKAPGEPLFLRKE